VAEYSGGSTSIVDSIVYDSFGQITYQSAPSLQPTFTYMGQRYDSDTGLYYEGSGSSWYSAVDGVFASQGAPGYNGSVNNPFEYMGNDPNMSQSSVGYTSGDFASGVGISGSGGSAVPVYYAGPTPGPKVNIPLANALNAQRGIVRGGQFIEQNTDGMATGNYYWGDGWYVLFGGQWVKNPQQDSPPVLPNGAVLAPHPPAAPMPSQKQEQAVAAQLEAIRAAAAQRRRQDDESAGPTGVGGAFDTFGAMYPNTQTPRTDVVPGAAAFNPQKKGKKQYGPVQPLQPKFNPYGPAPGFTIQPVTVNPYQPIPKPLYPYLPNGGAPSFVAPPGWPYQPQ
jgi:hypothetical protein